MKQLLFLLSFVLLCSCQPALRVIFGVKNPKIENQTTLKKFIKKNDFDIDLQYTYYLKNVENLYRLREVRERQQIRLFDVYLFNEAGYLIEEQLDSICFVARDLPIGDHKNYYDRVFSNPTIENGRVFHLDSLKKLLVDSDGNPIDSIRTNNKRTAIILWAKFFGRKQTSKNVEKSKDLLLETQLDLNIYYLNLDPQEFWEEESISITSK